LTTEAASTISQDQVEVHWQHPRHDLENPVLLIWPNPLRENWVAEVVGERRARVIARKVLVEEEHDGETEIESYTEPVSQYRERIPQYVEQALLEYEGEYGPIDSVANPVERDDTEVPDDPQSTFDSYFYQTREK